MLSIMFKVGSLIVIPLLSIYRGIENFDDLPRNYYELGLRTRKPVVSTALEMDQ